MVSAGSYFLRVFQYGSGSFGSKTITFKITNPQDVMTVYGYWGNMKLKSVTLVY